MTLTRAPFFLPGQSLESSGKVKTSIVFLVDDHPHSIEKLQQLIGDDPDVSVYCFDTVEDAEIAACKLQPTVFLISLPLLGYNGLEALAAVRSYATLTDLPLIILADPNAESVPSKPEAFRLGATDYLEKWPDRLEFVARLRNHTRAYGHLQERRKAYTDLQVSQAALKAELAEAYRYVQGLIPKPLQLDDLSIDWFLESSEYLGGDTLGFHAIDDRHWAFYVIDVCGHGVGAALFSVLILNSLSRASLPGVYYTLPAQVLTALNSALQMEAHAGMYFTAWYGVYDIEKRLLTYASGGHPPALLLPPRASSDQFLKALKTPGLVLGADIRSAYNSESVAIASGSCLYVFSDGVFEVECLPSHAFLGFSGWVSELRKPVPPGLSKPRFLFNAIRARHGRPTLEDDFTVLEVRFT